MTWYHELAIECATEEDAIKIVEYFNKVVKTYTSKHSVTYHTDLLGEGYWVQVGYPYFENESKLDSSYLYKSLQQSSLEYRFALAGLETSEFRTYSELTKELPTIEIPGLVISTKLAVRLDLTKWEDFSAGYIWQPYKHPHN